MMLKYDRKLKKDEKIDSIHFDEGTAYGRPAVWFTATSINKMWTSQSWCYPLVCFDTDFIPEEKARRYAKEIVDLLNRLEEEEKEKQKKKVEFKSYRRTNLAEMTPWTPDFDMSGVSVSKPDKDNGSPKTGDMIARNPLNHDDKWLVAAKYFKENFEETV